MLDFFFFFVCVFLFLLQGELGLRQMWRDVRERPRAEWAPRASAGRVAGGGGGGGEGRVSPARPSRDSRC